MKSNNVKTVLSTVLGLALASSALSKSITLQNGFDGYNGCRDALIAMMDPDEINDSAIVGKGDPVSTLEVPRDVETTINGEVTYINQNNLNFGNDIFIATHFCPS